MTRWPLDSACDTDLNLLLRPPAVGNAAESRTGLDSVDTRTLRDVLDEETELLDDGLLDLLAQAAA